MSHAYERDACAGTLNTAVLYVKVPVTMWSVTLNDVRSL